MNQAEWKRLVKDPASLQYNKDLPLVKELIESFPYFSTSYIWLARMLKDDNSIYMDKYLKLAATYAGDRELLYEFLHKIEAAEVEAVAEVNLFIPETTNQKNTGETEVLEGDKAEVNAATEPSTALV
nr:hypothetical protein [Bacteroidota bacterium]